MSAAAGREARPTFVLVHSPIVGPATWSGVRTELEARGRKALVPVLGQDDEAPELPCEQQSDALSPLVGRMGAG